ncbi:Avr1b-1 avirulence-like protein [Phytophthora cinnamomi]|uniref:Avr1b-1 avirulence-like protein n=1 Tax=Phytophthora cinnamomi TaxID=4785 RepID=UPI00355A8345|nr:Avr1b-1 avirulence-like protein [Phytophthora cinnamomi]
MPIVKKLETTIKKNPNFINELSKNPVSIKKLARDPEVAKVSAMIKKNNVKVTKDSIKRLRAAASNDPTMLSTLNGIARVERMVDGKDIFGVVIFLLFVTVLVLPMILIPIIK